jgi:hypothetical protein
MSDQSGRLHQAIMNLPCKESAKPEDYDWDMAYAYGHRDARHAAAELVVEFLTPAPPAKRLDVPEVRRCVVRYTGDVFLAEQRVGNSAYMVYLDGTEWDVCSPSEVTELDRAACEAAGYEWPEGWVEWQDDDTTDDGFGNVWGPCPEHGCKMQVVRPGKAVCPMCDAQPVIDAARKYDALIALLKSHGLPDGAEPGEWIAERLAKLHAIEEEATGEAAGNDIDGVEPHRVLEILVETRQALAAAEARAAEAERERDPPICRLQFPDGSVPGDVLECAEGWKRWYEQTYERVAELNKRIQSALTAAEARIAELEGENEQLRKGAPLGPIVGAQTIVEQEIELKRLRPLQADRAALAERIRGIAERWKAEAHAPTGEAYLVTKTSMADGLLAALELPPQRPQCICHGGYATAEVVAQCPIHAAASLVEGQPQGEHHARP